MSIEAILLGNAQDGGLPQAGCSCTTCQRAWEDPRQRRNVTCLGLIDREQKLAWLIDATPDFTSQLHLLQTHAPACGLSGILLTHAHIGHYTGLMHLGREAMNTRQLPVYGTPRMGEFLRSNAPWKQLFEIGNIAFHNLEPGTLLTLSPALMVIPLSVPHRGEFSDTLAYRIEGPGKRLLYCPDIDAWQRDSFDGRTLLENIDIALLDGTFFSEGELKGRDMREVPHPVIQHSLAHLTGAAAQIAFIHLNHTNPLWQPGPERAQLAASGFSVGEQGQSWKL